MALNLNVPVLAITYIRITFSIYLLIAFFD